MKLGTHVAAGLMAAGGITVLAAWGMLLLGAAAATAAKTAKTVFLAGSLYVGEQALSDVRSGRVSDLEQYARKGLVGSVVGFLTGASLGRVLALGFVEGLLGSIVTQKLLNDDGEDRLGSCGRRSRIFRGYSWVCMENRKGGVKGVGGGSETY